MPPPLGFLWVSFVPSQTLLTATLATAAAAAGVPCSGSYSRTSILSSARGYLGTPTYTGLGRFPCPQACSCHVTAPLSPCGRVTCPPQIHMQTCTGHIHSTCSSMQVRVLEVAAGLLGVGGVLNCGRHQPQALLAVCGSGGRGGGRGLVGRHAGCWPLCGCLTCLVADAHHSSHRGPSFVCLSVLSCFDVCEQMAARTESCC